MPSIFHILAFWIVVLPLAGWAIIGLFGKNLSPSRSGLIATTMISLSFILGIVTVFLGRIHHFPFRVVYGNWIVAATLEIPFGFQIDQLSLLMVCTVTGVSALIHYYSISYMGKDPDHSRYFSYLNLFVFFMLVLVLADNFVLMFVGWEGVGLCSYLLIGFWYKNQAPVRAGKKAFIINRIGDAAFLIGLFLMAASPLSSVPDGIMRSLTYDNVFGNVLSFYNQQWPFIVDLLPLITIITLLLFIGATGKSAQIPLYVWLPDAMEGPTPVSALIHAATMVTAGVYMVARAHVLFLFAPITMAVIVIVGAATAIFAGTIAIVQTDIKKVLAYSTISQLGYMFIACGVGAFTAGIFHLFTHAFFKACLFLCAGSVIMGTGHIQDMRKLGGLKKYMPKTRMAFLISTAAISGFPLMSGFFSKDRILHESFVMPFAFGWNITAGVIGYITAFVTAFYMFRLYYKIFEGEYLGPTDREPHETGRGITDVLWIFAAASVVVGLFGLPIAGFDLVGKWLDPIFAKGTESALKIWDMKEQHVMPWMFMGISVLIYLAGWFLARHIYLIKPGLSKALKVRYQTIYRLLWDKYRLEDAYRAIFVHTGQWLCSILWRNVDEAIIDKGLVEGTGKAAENVGTFARILQNGYIRTYALYIVLGVVILIWFSIS